MPKALKEEFEAMEQEAIDAINELHNDDGPCMADKRLSLERIKEHVDTLLYELD